LSALDRYSNVVSELRAKGAGAAAVAQLNAKLVRHRGTAATLGFALLVSAAIFLFSQALNNEMEADAVLFLLIFPVGYLSARLGTPSGLAGATGAMGLVAIGGDGDGPGTSPLEYIVHALVFFGVVVAVAILRLRAPAEAASVQRLLTARPQIFREPLKAERLSGRELEVLGLIAKGATNAQVAASLVVSEDTVKSHVKHILQKLGVRNRTEAALRYVELYGTPPGEPEAGPGTGSGTRRQSGSSALGAAMERKARVVEVSSSDRVVLGLENGHAIEVPVLEALRHRLEPGKSALVYFSQRGEPVGWYLPDEDLGVDVRRWNSP
jgi:DNA-binding CsgD family transcriptional regulator